MDKKLLISGFAAFLIFFLCSWLVHGVLVHGDYLRMPNIFRPQSELGGFYPFLALAVSVARVRVRVDYRQGISPDRPWLVQGIRFGIAAALLATVPMYLTYYVILPMEGSTVVKQIVGDSIALIICGVIVAFINRRDDAGDSLD